MNVCSPHELYRTPRLRQAARTLCASGRERGGQSCGNRENSNACDNETEARPVKPLEQEKTFNQNVK